MVTVPTMDATVMFRVRVLLRSIVLLPVVMVATTIYVASEGTEVVA